MIDSKRVQNETFFPKQINKDQAKDTGMAMVLICLLLWFPNRNESLIVSGFVLLLIDMIFPSIFKPVAKIWLGISNIMGTIMSKILLSIIFYIIVTPVGIARKLAGIDTLNLKKWKKDNTSVFKIRNHSFKPEEIERPY